MAGGAANVALNLASLGASVETVGWFGKDEQGDELVEILCKKNIKVDHVGSPISALFQLSASQEITCFESANL